MTNESLSATVTINAPAETVFAMIADPASHAATDGTGWVSDPLDGSPPMLHFADPDGNGFVYMEEEAS